MQLITNPAPTVERTIERFRRATKSMKVREDRERRRQLAATIAHRPELDHLISETTGYAKIPLGTVGNVEEAVKFSQKTLAERRDMEWPDEKRQLVVLLDPERYEEAPPLFDLALSDDILQIATEYLDEVPILMRVKLWWTPVNSRLTGSQLYHRDGMNWLQRQAKFLFVMNDVGEDCGPFTFIPADVSRRIANSLGSLRGQERVDDEMIFRYARPEDEVRLVGPAGTGAVVDSSRCFHYGARARGGERLMIVFNFMGSIDVPLKRVGPVRRTAAFRERFGDDPVRELVLPLSE